jgi:Uma2 family endonuclease
MANATTLKSEFANVAELQEFLGDIPTNRIRLRPTPGHATEEDLLEIQAREGRICELIDGVLVEKVMATFESRLAAVLIFYIETFLNGKKLGAVLAGDGLLRLFPGRVRAPDVSFISWKQMRGRVFPRDKIASLSPDLAVEILSERNTDAEMNRKLREYFQSGSRLVWYVDPNTRAVRVYTNPRKSVLLTEDQSLDGGKVLPGFSLSIRAWFERATGEDRA